MHLLKFFLTGILLSFPLCQHRRIAIRNRLESSCCPRWKELEGEVAKLAPSVQDHARGGGLRHGNQAKYSGCNRPPGQTRVREIIAVPRLSLIPKARSSLHAVLAAYCACSAEQLAALRKMSHDHGAITLGTAILAAVDPTTPSNHLCQSDGRSAGSASAVAGFFFPSLRASARIRRTKL